MEIKLESVTKKYNDFTAVNNVSLSVKNGELLALLGSSGCGKTTLLRIIAGLIKQDEGRIYLNEKDISNWPPQNRNTAMVFQNYALFPHMTVEENVAYGLKVRKISKDEIRQKVNETLTKVRLEGLGKRKIQEISGGQRQRVALARSLVIEPDILLFDEPLSNLDEKLRVSMRKEIRRIQKETNITTVYVTHDQREAMSIADKIVIMNEGNIYQIGTPDDVYFRPANYFTAEFMGHPNIIELADNGKKTKGFVEVLGVKIEIDNKRDALYALLRPEEIRLSDRGVEARILDFEIMGAIKRYKLSVRDTIVYADFLNRMDEHHLAVDNEIKIDFDTNSVHFFGR